MSEDTNPLSDSNMDTISDILLENDIGTDEDTSNTTGTDNPDEVVISLDTPFGSNTEHVEPEPEPEPDAESEPEPDAESDFGTHANEAPSTKIAPTQESVQQQATELAEASDQIYQMYQSNQISAEQYEHAMHNATVRANDLRAQDLQLKEQAVQTYVGSITAHNEMNKQVAEILPEWNNPNNRPAMIEKLTNYAMDTLGMTEAEIRSVKNPMVLTRLYQDMERRHEATASRQLQKIKRTKQTKVKAKAKSQPSTGYLSNRDEQADAIARLLI